MALGEVGMVRGAQVRQTRLLSSVDRGSTGSIWKRSGYVQAPSRIMTRGVDGNGTSSPQVFSDFKVSVFSAKPYVKRFLAPQLECIFPNCSWVEHPLDSDTAPLASGADAVCLFVNDTADAEVLEILAEGGVKMIALRCSGFDRVDLKKAEELGIKIARVPKYSPYAVSEQAVGLLLCLNRKIHKAYSRVRDGNFALTDPYGMDMHGKVAGVIGTGQIGSNTVRILAGFGCKVLASDVYESDEVKAIGAQYVDQKQLLQESDFVFLHCPLLPSTYHLIDTEGIANMKEGAFLINVSRGGLCDTTAVIQGLRSGKLRGVALDVYEHEESLFFEDLSALNYEERISHWDLEFSQLISFPNVIVTPHQAFFTQDALENITRQTIENLTEFALGQELHNAVLAPK